MNAQKIPIIQTMHHSFFLLRKIQERKKEDSLYRFEQFTKRKAGIFHADDEIIPEILESTRLEEDLSREDRSKNTDCILFTESFVQTCAPNIYLFNYILEIVKQKIPYKCITLTQENHLLLVLMKLKLGPLHTDLAYIFSFSFSNVGCIYKGCITILSDKLEMFTARKRCTKQKHT